MVAIDSFSIFNVTSNKHVFALQLFRGSGQQIGGT